MEIAVRKKSGVPDVDQINDPLHLQNYTPLCKYLNETKKLAVTEHMLSQFAYSILLFMETHFGKKQENMAVRSKIVKLPSSTFRDFRISGGLCTVFEVAARHTNISNWMQINFLDDKNFESITQLLLDIEKSLLQSGLLRRPTFFFGNSVLEQPHGAQLVRELTNIALSHGGNVTDDQLKASFVVLWDDEVDGTLGREIQDEYIRPLEIRPHQQNGAALVHWWYHPDSYDEWIPSQDVQCTDIPDEEKYSSLYQKSGFYQPSNLPTPTTYVCCRYLKDVEDFNEWGNLLDYEMDKPLEGAVESQSTGARKGRGKKRGVDRRQNVLQRQQQNGIQQNSFVVQAVSVTERMLQDLPPPSVHDSNSQFNSSSTNQKFNVVDVLANQPCGMSVEAAQNVTRDVAEVKEDETGEGDAKRKRENDDINDDMDRKRISISRDDSAGNEMKDHAVLNVAPSGVDMSQILPTSKMPSWFDADTISTVEMKYISDIIVPSSGIYESNISGDDRTAARAVTQNDGQKYIIVRNSIVHLYHHDPSICLTATECRRKIAGDVSYIIRVHEFLDVFGVINYSPEIKNVVRNPKSSIFYSTCPDNIMPSKQKSEKACSTEEVSKKTNKSMWNSHLDQVLLSAVTAAMTQGEENSSDSAMEVEGSFHEVGGINWSRVANVVAAQADEKRQIQFTSVACLVRFTEMTLGNMSANAVVPGSGSVSSRVDMYVASGSSVSKHVRSLASVVTSAAAEHLNIPRLQALARSIQSSVQNFDLPAAAGAALTTGAAVVVSAAEKSAASKLSQAESHLDEYISLRLSVLEKKMELVGDIEDALLIEKDRVELDRHDLQVERAQHASFVQAETQLNLF